MAARYGFDGLCGVVPPVEQPQGGIVESLYSHADAVEGQGGKHSDIGIREVVRIGFEGNLCGMLQPVDALDGAEHLSEILFRQLRRRASAEIDRLYGFPSQVPFALRQFAAKGTDVSGFQLRTGSGVEVAIDAAGLAERNMYINACHDCTVFIVDNS